MKNTRHIFDAARAGIEHFATLTGLDEEAAATLMAVSDLCRIQWVSPAYAHACAAAGYKDAAAVAGADPTRLCAEIAKANVDAAFFRGTVGLRDVRRLVAAAAYVP